MALLERALHAHAGMDHGTRFGTSNIGPVDAQINAGASLFKETCLDYSTAIRALESETWPAHARQQVFSDIYRGGDLVIGVDEPVLRDGSWSIRCQLSGIVDEEHAAVGRGPVEAYVSGMRWLYSWTASRLEPDIRRGRGRPRAGTPITS